MTGTNFRMPARRFAALATATALTAGPVVLAGASTAHATEQGRASAVVLRTGLDVSLLNKTVQVPLTVSLNEVQAPASAQKTALTATLDGVDKGKPFQVLRADVAEARADVSDGKAEASSRLAHARLHVPGLPLLSLIEVGAVSSKAVCETGKAPVADANLLGAVTVLGKKVTVSAGGTTAVTVPGVGEVRLDLSKRETTSRTAAATALELSVSVNPLSLNVAEVTGNVTLVKSTCETPTAPAPAPPKEEGTEQTSVKPQEAGAPVEANLAETGGSSSTPYIAGGAAALLAVGGGAVFLARRGRRN
ncbi:LPXTG cell wall anchor domain-containing protein [Streptomyces roseirectus]|uniref:LPXTG cell wall anchor domain-containing protein n=1 Tax=Streptomyces roseirectus TaxID=2768066 RepID=A0A7H0IKZ5_9ACTN|nr:SCO1860 family LAETG-anchored protein [Streptomyces roseirectus]QNP73461.1 LPXTG cell wall anchor domain-containing protein [Streptomyces roseirectus]